MDHPILVIGGGMAGITAAVELAETGKKVVLVEKEPYLGGQVSAFASYFPKLCPPSCGLEINYRRIRSNPGISYYTGAEVTGISGCEGDFSVELTLAPRFINNLCTSCGLCAEACPEDAAYIPRGMSFPMKYSIDPERCTGVDCARCVEVCEYDAIHLDASDAEITLKAGRIILATGWQPYDPGLIENYHYTQLADVVSNLELEHMLAAATEKNTPLLRPSDGKAPGRVAFVQCAGSRDLQHLPYCSAVCCSASVKHALMLTEAIPELECEIFYIDMRLGGRNEKLLSRVEEKGRIRLRKGKVGTISAGKTGPLLEVEDIELGRKRKEEFDLVVLAVGLVPSPLKVALPVNAAGFYLDECDGIIVAGSCKRPMDVSCAVKDASAAALKAMKE
jgi:quinone-modifying oxidoreductase subunit QmoA